MNAERAPLGFTHIVLGIMKPWGMSSSTWDFTVSHLEELGLFPGRTLTRLGSTGPRGAVIFWVMGSRVALSRDLARAILVRQWPHRTEV